MAWGARIAALPLLLLLLLLAAAAAGGNSGVHCLEEGSRSRRALQGRHHLRSSKLVSLMNHNPSSSLLSARLPLIPPDCHGGIDQWVGARGNQKDSVSPNGHV